MLKNYDNRLTNATNKNSFAASNQDNQSILNEKPGWNEDKMERAKKFYSIVL